MNLSGELYEVQCRVLCGHFDMSLCAALEFWHTRTRSPPFLNQQHGILAHLSLCHTHVHTNAQVHPPDLHTGGSCISQGKDAQSVSAAVDEA